MTWDDIPVRKWRIRSDLAGEPDAVKVVHPGERPALKSKLKQPDPERFRDLREPTSYAVGTEFRHAIERWEIEYYCSNPGVETERTVRRTCVMRIPTCTGPDQAARNRACAFYFQSPSRAITQEWRT
jgi:hypothetical protein